MIRDPLARELLCCPYCDGVEYERGPRGGICCNVTCIGCGARFNIVDHPGMPRYIVNELARPQ